MLFLARFWPGLLDGCIALTLRGCPKVPSQAGGRHRFAPFGALEITPANRVNAGRIPDGDVAAAGFESGHDLRQTLEKAARRERPGADTVWWLGLHFVAERDPRLPLGEAGPAPEETHVVLGKLRREAPRGLRPHATLENIERRPQESAKHLTADLGRERESFKVDVRKLKKRGLTMSCDIGYRLSVRGQTVLAGLPGADR